MCAKEVVREGLVLLILLLIILFLHNNLHNLVLICIYVQHSVQTKWKSYYYFYISMQPFAQSIALNAQPKTITNNYFLIPQMLKISILYFFIVIFNLLFIEDFFLKFFRISVHNYFFLIPAQSFASKIDTIISTDSINFVSKNVRDKLSSFQSINNATIKQHIDATANKIFT